MSEPAVRDEAPAAVPRRSRRPHHRRRRWRGGLRPCAAVALAAERYRLAGGTWPKSLDALVPDYLAAGPADPFGGKPLRLGHLPDGLVVYSVGPDRTDDGGKIARGHPGAPGTDVGLQLWNVDQRGKR